MSDHQLLGQGLAGDPNLSSNLLAASGSFDPTHPYTEIQMPDGHLVRLPTSALLQSSGIENTTIDGIEEVPSSDLSSSVIPLIEERLQVGKRTVATGKVRLTKTVQEYSEALDERLAVRTFDVERHVLNQPVEVPPPVRQDGTTTIYSIVEEQLILTKQLVLKEEVWIVQRDTERHDTQVVTLHKEHLIVERAGLE